jgi:hypothetical protein
MIITLRGDNQTITLSGKKKFTPIDVDSWGKYKEKLKELQNKRTWQKNSTTTQVSNFLYRRQGDASWPIYTILERELKALGSNIQSVLSSNYQDQAINRIFHRNSRECERIASI